jgi:glutamyl-Q tRNA(Asp) synthetase
VEMVRARGAGGTMRLRIEDIDGTRSRPEHVAGIIEDLRWLGVEWDGDILFQSQRIGHYMAALDRLRDMGLLYPCFCTRADIQASLTAPHGPEGPVYPGTCRALGAEEQTHRIAAGKAHAWRIDMAQATARAGPLCWHAFGAEGGEVIAANPAVHGDVVLARKDAPASYHLSCTLDDAAMGVTHVLRGADLRHATDIHRLLQAVLDLPSPAYRHHPLLVDAQGRRLAKRSGSLSLAQLRTQGIDPRVLAADLRAGRFPVGISGGKA